VLVPIRPWLWRWANLLHMMKMIGCGLDRRGDDHDGGFLVVIT
jgi:hypothetical protein